MFGYKAHSKSDNEIASVDATVYERVKSWTKTSAYGFNQSLSGFFEGKTLLVRYSAIFDHGQSLMLHLLNLVTCPN